MKKGVSLFAAALLIAPFFAKAQAPADSLLIPDDSHDFSFTESQLDEDADAAQAVSTISSASNDPFLSEVGYLFSPMRYRVRAFENTSSQTYINGVMLNDLERGQFSYGMIGGLNDATRNRESASSFEANNFGYLGEGGGQNIQTRASQFAQGSKLALSGCNRNYVARAMFTHATGISPKGWSAAFSLGYRWAERGQIEGTFYNAFSYFLALEKRFNSQHSLSLVTFGAPTERGQQGASTEEAYWLANDRYYNPNWGYQNGSMRNARVVNDYSPTAILTWDWKMNPETKLVTSFAGKYSMYSSTALGWNGEAYDPRPDYYKNMPSSIFNVWDPEKNNAGWLAANPEAVDQWNSLYEYWTSSKANRQINWDRMYYVNQQNAALGGETLYYQERRHNDQLTFALNSTLEGRFNRASKYVLGVELNHTEGYHYKTMADLLGGEIYIDYDKFSANDYGRDSQEAQNDLRNPNRRIYVDDKFGYDYDILVNKARLWGLYETKRGIFDLTLSAYGEGTTIERDGKMQNGRAPHNSFGKSGAAKFFGGGGKAQLLINPGAGHRISIGAGYEKRAPLARNAFVAPRLQNDFVNNLKLEDVLSSELAYTFRWGILSGKVNAYYTRYMNQVEQTAFYNDQESRFTYLAMSGIDKEHYGVEAALSLQVTSNLKFNFIGSIGEAQYINNPYAQVNYEGMDAKTTAELNKWTVNLPNGTTVNKPLRVIADGCRVSGTPLTAASVGVSYNRSGWFLEANLNYYDRTYIGYSAYRRLSNVMQNEVFGDSFDANGNPVWQHTGEEYVTNGGIRLDQNGNVVEARTAKQEKCKGGFMLDASIGRFIRLSRGRSLSINLSLQNILNNQDLRTGGYEQNRDDYYATGEQRTYQFSKNPKYYYANMFNFFLNVGFKF